MTATLKKYKLEELVFPGKGNLVSGPFGSNISSKFFVNDGVPVIRGNNLTKGNKKFIDDGYVYITNEKAYELRNCLANTDDILFTAAGTLGQIGIMPSNLKYEKYIISNKQIRLRCNTEIVNPTFLYYYLINPQMRVFIESQNKGSSIPLLTLGSLKWLPIDLPPLPAQQKIAKILSNYDDLIENNLKRIKLLEESARLTYEEWFLRFRIDGKKLDIDASTGLPFGWELVKVSSLLQRVQTTVKIKSSEILKSGKNPVIDQGTDFIAGYTNEANINQYTDNSFIVFGDHTRILKFVNFSFARGADGTQILISNNSRMPQTLFYHSLIAVDLSNYHYARHFKFLKEEKVILPKGSIATKYNNKCVTIFDQIKNLRNQNQFLKEARDILLPRLMTGMIDTDDMDKVA